MLSPTLPDMTPARSRWPSWLSLLLLWALLWAPLWGQWHGVAHGPHLAHLTAPGQQGLHTAEEALPAAHADDSGHVADADLCQLLDHLSQAERLRASNLHGQAPQLLAQHPVFRAVLGAHRDRWSPVQARAPPELI